MDRGRIFQLNTAPGGVPKHAVARATVTTDSLVGDGQNDLKHHGGPDRAVCLFSLERILALQEEGHPIFPGAAGENVTVAGLDWDTMQPGDRYRLGGEVEIEIVKFTPPCKTIAPFFTEGKFLRISQKHHPGWSRVYARVLQEGAVGVGDRVVRVAAPPETEAGHR